MKSWQKILEEKGIPSQKDASGIITAKYSIYELSIESNTISGIPCASLKEGGQNILIAVNPSFAIDQFEDLLNLPACRQPSGFAFDNALFVQ